MCNDNSNHDVNDNICVKTLIDCQDFDSTLNKQFIRNNHKSTSVVQQIHGQPQQQTETDHLISNTIHQLQTDLVNSRLIESETRTANHELKTLLHDSEEVGIIV